MLKRRVKRYDKKKLMYEYFVKWKNYELEFDRWYEKNFLTNAKNMIQNYDNQHDVFVDENIRRSNKSFLTLDALVFTSFFSSNNSFSSNVSTSKRERNRSRRQLIVINEISFFSFFKRSLRFRWQFLRSSSSDVKLTNVLTWFNMQKIFRNLKKKH